MRELRRGYGLPPGRGTNIDLFVCPGSGRTKTVSRQHRFHSCSGNIPTNVRCRVSSKTPRNKRRANEALDFLRSQGRPARRCSFPMQYVEMSTWLSTSKGMLDQTRTRSSAAMLQSKRIREIRMTKARSAPPPVLGHSAKDTDSQTAFSPYLQGYAQISQM